jgi:hypothetical protein
MNHPTKLLAPALSLPEFRGSASLTLPRGPR